MTRPATSVFALCAGIFLATANFGIPHSIDSLTNALTAWKVGTSGTVVLDEYGSVAGLDHFNRTNQLLDSERGPISKYPPGAALVAAPLFTVVRAAGAETSTVVATTIQNPGDTETRLVLPGLWPASVIAALATAGAAAAVTASMVPSVGATWAALTGLGLGLGTSMWSVASSELWQHGPTALWIALGVLACSRSRFIPGGVAFGLAIVTRPQAAVIAAGMGVWLAVHRRSVRTVFAVGLPAAVALALYIAFNLWAFSSPLPRLAGGYWVESGLAGSLASSLGSFILAFVDPRFGVFVWSPVVLVALFRVPRVWNDSPGWMRAAAIAGAAYLFFQVRGNGYAGGSGFLWYRYQLEALAAASPLLGASVRSAFGAGPLWRGALALAAAASVATHAVGAFLG